MTVTSSEHELVDVLDAAGTVVGTAPRWQVRRDNLLHRSVFVAVVNDAAELLVHRRADWKDVWPGHWDLAFGGVVDHGEAWEAAAMRELAEEAGIAAELVYLGEGRYEDAVVREIARVYLARHDGPVSFHDGEVTAVEWVPLAAMRAWLEGREVCPDSRDLVLPRLDAP
ncbi:NUDIX domain-containing protein [Rhabdothermincola sp.]|uniref:NUDIX domain-containing protein n=1 Tax=Rhabdothermincola sp. TaxID=2820405 RepID=UPI002FE2E07D